MKDHFKNFVEPSIGDPTGAFAFSASVSYEHRTEFTKEKSEVFTDAFAMCKIYEAGWGFNEFPLSSTFRSGVLSIAPSDTEGWYRFIEYFGTHYLRKAKWGAKEVQESMITKQSVETLESQNIKVSTEAKASFDIATGAIKVESESEKEKREKFEKECQF